MTQPDTSRSRRLKDRWLRWRLRNVTIVQGQPTVRKVDSGDPTKATFRYEIPTRIEVHGRVSKRLVRRLAEQERR